MIALRLGFYLRGEFPLHGKRKHTYRDTCLHSIEFCPTFPRSVLSTYLVRRCMYVYSIKNFCGFEFSRFSNRTYSVSNHIPCCENSKDGRPTDLFYNYRNSKVFFCFICSLQNRPQGMRARRRSKLHVNYRIRLGGLFELILRSAVGSSTSLTITTHSDSYELNLWLDCPLGPVPTVHIMISCIVDPILWQLSWTPTLYCEDFLVNPVSPSSMSLVFYSLFFSKSFEPNILLSNVVRLFLFTHIKHNRSD